MTVDRRGRPRYRLRLPVRYWADGLEGHATTSNIAERGLLIEGVDAELPSGKRLHLEIKLPDWSFLAEAKVTRIIEAADGRPRAAALRLMNLFECIPGGTVTRSR